MPNYLIFSGGFRGDAGGAAAPPLASFRKIHGLPISKTVRTADSTIIIITNFYLAASSQEIFLTVGGREVMKGLGALQRHQLPHPPCKNPGSATANFVHYSVEKHRRMAHAKNHSIHSDCNSMIFLQLYVTMFWPRFESR